MVNAMMPFEVLYCFRGVYAHLTLCTVPDTRLLDATISSIVLNGRRVLWVSILRGVMSGDELSAVRHMVETKIVLPRGRHYLIYLSVVHFVSV